MGLALPLAAGGLPFALPFAFAAAISLGLASTCGIWLAGSGMTIFALIK